MIPRKFEPTLFSLIFSGVMSFLASGIASLRAIGMSDDIAILWGSSWLATWIVAFPAVMVVSPFVRKIVQMVIAES